MVNSNFLWSLTFALTVTVCQSESVNLTALFGPHLSPNASIVLPSNPNYTTELTQRWSTWSAPTFFGAIIPATTQDVQNIVSRASSREYQAVLSIQNPGQNCFREQNSILGDGRWSWNCSRLWNGERCLGYRSQQFQDHRSRCTKQLRNNWRGSDIWRPLGSFI
jgi:hypothetical protein